MFKGNTLPDILTVDDLAEYLSISKCNAYLLLTSGEINGVKIGRIWRIPRNSVEEYINSKL